MKRLAKLALVLLFLVALFFSFMRTDKLDDLAIKAAEFRAAMAGSYQFQAQGAMITLSHDNTCLLILDQMHPDVAWYKQGQQAFLHTQLTGIKELTTYWQKHPKSDLMLTHADMPQDKKSIRVVLEKMVDINMDKKQLIWQITPKGKGDCHHSVFHEVIGSGY